MHDWPDRLEGEFEQWKDFRTTPLCPYGKSRPKVPAAVLAVITTQTAGYVAAT